AGRHLDVRRPGAPHPLEEGDTGAGARARGACGVGRDQSLAAVGASRLAGVFERAGTTEPVRSPRSRPGVARAHLAVPRRAARVRLALSLARDARADRLRPGPSRACPPPALAYGEVRLPLGPARSPPP